jgi:leader peptidase (prepilin peptidase) / N-methyltransferase
MVSFELVLAAVLGLVAGSFSNVLIYRVPRRESILFPGSHCTSCGAAIRWYQNVPVLSWCFLGGRCARCRSRISIRYPLVEMLMGLLFALAVLRWGVTGGLPAAWAFCLFVVPLAFIDFDLHLLPDRLTYPGMVAGVAFSFAAPWTDWKASLAGAVLGAGLPAVLIGLYALRGVDAMGWGDVKFMALVGAFLGWRGALLTLLAGAILGTIIGGGYLLVTGKGRRTPLPFGTFLAAGGLFALFLGGPLWAWYMGLLAVGRP